MELGGFDGSEFLATLVADHGTSLAGLELGDLGLGGFFVILLSLVRFLGLDLVKRLVLVLLQPLKSSLDW